MPVRSGLPSDVRGAGAETFGLPFARRGMPGVVMVHCPKAGAAKRAATATDVRAAFIEPPWRRLYISVSSKSPTYVTGTRSRSVCQSALKPRRLRRGVNFASIWLRSYSHDGYIQNSTPVCGRDGA